jgi:peptide/nickel transport system permease protein
MLVPAVILAIPTSALLARYARGAVIDCLAQDYVKTALSRGGDSRRIIFKHVLRNALIPVTTMTGLTLANLVGGTVIIESVFAIPGIGSLLISSINASDYPVIQACVMVLGVLYVVINFGIDLLYPVIDPRVRLQR